jgi:putative nucleotidyltransferase with HDIG domain
MKAHENILKMTSDEAMEYLLMIIYTIDFKSKSTVVHSVSTAFLSVYLAEHVGLSKEEKEKIKVASLIHDIGKIAVPVSILEYPGKLDSAKMAVMKKHINYTEQIMQGIIPKDISDIAVRHHEKLDGSGYPLGLKAKNLSKSDRIVAIADIISALSGSRSYKEGYEKEKTISILEEMVKEGKLDGEIVELATDNFDDMISQMYDKTKNVTEMYEKITKEFDSLVKAEI